MTSHQVTCVTKSSNHEQQHHLTHLGGQTPQGRGWRLTITEAIKGILAGKWHFFVMNEGKPISVMVAADRSGSRYLRLETDTPGHDGLLSLNACSDNHSTHPEHA